MKLDLKKIIIPGLISVFSMSTIIGTTFALFTDKNETVINVQSGQIITSVNIDNLEAYSAKKDDGGTLIDENGAKYSYEQQQGLYFANGGAIETNNNNLLIKKITPGDRVDGKLVYTNSSNIKTKYRIRIETREDDYLLASALEIKIDGHNTAALASYYSAWFDVPAQDQTSYVREVLFSITMPIDKQNEYQDKECEYTFRVETVQGNAETSGSETYNQIASQMTLLNSSDLNVVTDAYNNTTTTLANNKNIEVTAPNSSSTVVVNIPEGVKLNNDANGLALVVAKAEETNFSVDNGETIDNVYNIDVAGLANDNTSLITVTVPYTSSIAPAKIIHLKDNGTKEEILPYSELNPNGFNYAGGYITFKTSTFSSFAVITQAGKIYFNQKWPQVYAYMRNDTKNNGAFPGVEITGNVHIADNGLGVSVLEVDPLDYKHVAFSNGSGTQTVDINITPNAVYWITTQNNEGKFNVQEVDYTDAYKNIYFTSNAGWTDVYAYLWKEGAAQTWPDWPGTKLENPIMNSKDEPVYYVPFGSYDRVVFNNGSGDQTVNIAITPSIDYYLNGGWDGKNRTVSEAPMYSIYYDSLTDAVNNAESGDKIELMEDIEITGPFIISKDFTMDLKGHNIRYSEAEKYKDGATHNVFIINEGVTFNLIDTSGTKNYGKWVDNAYDIKKSETEGYHEFTGGIIYGGYGISDLHPSVYSQDNGGAIINKGTLNINGANIAGNLVEGGNAAGISNLSTGTVNLISGSISDNKCPSGSGSAIYNDGGTFNMSGGEIANNVAYRGTIIVRGSEFNFTGGSIHDNQTYQYGIDITGRSSGGVTTYGNMVMEDGTSIYNNNNTGSVGGAVFVRNNCTFTMNGGSIYNNTTAHSVGYPNPADYVYNGGAIALNENAICEIFGGSITGNIGGAIHVGDEGNRLRIKGFVRICDNWFDSISGTKLDIFMDNRRGMCPHLVGALEEGSSIGLYEGHYLGDPDTYGCVLKIDYKHTEEEGETLLSYLYSTKDNAKLIYQASCTSNVNYWGGESYIRQLHI